MNQDIEIFESEDPHFRLKNLGLRYATSVVTAKVAFSVCTLKHIYRQTDILFTRYRVIANYIDTVSE